jgi:Cu/Ag efflux protein CusF
MKKVLLVALAIVISVAFISTVFAQAPSEKKEMKAKAMSFSGEVTNMDMAAKMMTVKGKDKDMTFDVSGAKIMGEMKAGDKVSVKYMEKDGKMMASSVKMAGGKKMEKKEMKEEKK